ncbi:acyl-CoA reductase-like NAD-dependent aldehyde dehydrogenase [Mycolicibacterium moriokaense]|uniref:Acyl-CoA reductase-like NAD-dependent aldehyde dehydrogenase n=2 Tax=Mycolicibacterium moriokaense TaxID=39691 RepID=A0A318HES2_9MYCO|nr:acyl-CoA reductase [Mycolicibacterium moriokaense]PXX07418.1 acyl-CoA reductase-like NAD-dependent aldehyde dehydrogenase [Mycolicibacterium moriokaense]
MTMFTVPLFIRGELITDDLVEFGTRLEHRFEAPDPVKHAHALPLRSPVDMADMYTVSFDEILDVLTELGQALAFEKNTYIQEAFEACLVSNPMPESILRTGYVALPAMFTRDSMRELAETQVGIEYLEGWVPRRLLDGREIRVRAFGSRTLHIPAGNGGLVAGITVLRNALTRSDAIIKAPSNDPLTAMAIARTLADIAPDHPITRHLAVGYWKGGDEQVEEQLYKPEHVEKIVAWGGLASVKHVTRYIQPGLELIALDPKRSATIIGPEAFNSEDTLREVAMRAACDVGAGNQEGCVNARVIYVLSGTDQPGLDNANRLGGVIYQSMMQLPEFISTKPKVVDRTLLEHIEGSRLTDDWYRVFGGEDTEGAIIVSQIDEPVHYSTMLSGRVANVVPVDSIDKVTDAVNAYTQTIGIYPESLKHELRDRLPLFGAQRLTSLGYAASVNFTIPQDAMEPVRRMCKWIVDEECEPDRVFPLWETPDLEMA